MGPELLTGSGMLERCNALFKCDEFGGLVRHDFGRFAYGLGLKDENTSLDEAPLEALRGEVFLMVSLIKWKLLSSFSISGLSSVSWVVDMKSISLSKLRCRESSAAGDRFMLFVRRVT